MIVSVDPYEGMSDVDIDDYFRMGWIAHQAGEEFILDHPKAWREGWLKARKSNEKLAKEKHEPKEATTSRNR